MAGLFGRSMSIIYSCKEGETVFNHFYNRTVFKVRSRKIVSTSRLVTNDY